MGWKCFISLFLMKLSTHSILQTLSLAMSFLYAPAAADSVPSQGISGR